MSEPLLSLLRTCAEQAPAPWYPKTGPMPSGMSRLEVDEGLERLRLNGFVALTEWVAGHGQGYILTPPGIRALADPRLLDRPAVEPVPPLVEDPVGGPTRSGGSWERGEAVREALLNPQQPIITYALLALCVTVFMLGTTGAVKIGAKDVQDFLTLRHSDVRQGGWRLLRLLSCCFTHGDGLHLLMNMWGLYAIGPMQERMWGRLGFLLLFLISGLVGSCVAVAPMVIQGAGALRGASGAIWGSMAAMGVWVYLNRNYLPPQLRRSWATSLVNVLIINVVVSFLPGISAAAHFAGGGAGAACAFALHGVRHGGLILRTFSLIMLLLLPLGSIGSLIYLREDTPLARLRRQLAQQLPQGGQNPVAVENRDALGAALDDVAELERAAWQPYLREVKELLDRRPERRREAQVTAAQFILTRGRPLLETAERRLEHLEELEDAGLEEQRQQRLALIRTRLELFDLAKRLLERGENDDTALSRLEQKERELDARSKSGRRR